MPSKRGVATDVVAHLARTLIDRHAGRLALGLAIVLLPGIASTALVPTAHAQSAAAPAARLSERQIAHGTDEMRLGQDGANGTVGAVTYNSFVELSGAQARRDVRALTARSDVDLIGFEEANPFGEVYRELPGRGWGIVQKQFHGGSFAEVALAYRQSRFTFVDSTMTKMHDDSRKTNGDNSTFPGRYVLRVTLATNTAEPALLEVFVTHVNQHIERWDDRAPGVAYQNVNARRAKKHLGKLAAMLASSTARYTVVLGDFNWDYVSDQKTLKPNFVEGRLGGLAVSSWESLGVHNKPPTHPPSHRRIDYVFLTRTSRAGFRSQDVLGGYRSDHRPLLTRIALD